MRPHPALGRSRRLLHHVSELPGQSQAVAIGKQRGFDVKDVAAGFRPCETRDHTGPAFFRTSSPAVNGSGPSISAKILRRELY